MTEIPKFKINQIQIHEIPIWKFNNPVVNYINKPVVDIPGCVRVHRNNLTSLIDNLKMNMELIQNVVTSVFLVLNLWSITPMNLSTHRPKPPIKQKSLYRQQ